MNRRKPQSNNLSPFGDHSSGHSRFCGFKRKPQEKYIHRSLPHKTFVIILDINVKKFLDPVINNIEQMAYLESIQQCELTTEKLHFEHLSPYTMEIRNPWIFV